VIRDLAAVQLQSISLGLLAEHSLKMDAFSETGEGIYL
jgi:hypothetical protein